MSRFRDTRLVSVKEREGEKKREKVGLHGIEPGSTDTNGYQPIRLEYRMDIGLIFKNSLGITLKLVVSI